MNYSIEYHRHDKYLAVIYSSSYINPVDSIKEINGDMERNLLKEGFVLFDLLLSNGNNFNRFFEAYFDGHEIKKDTVTVVVSKEIDDLKSINSHYKGRIKELNNSVLSPSEKYRLLKK